MSYCRQCGAEVLQEQSYCRECGVETAARVEKRNLKFDDSLLDGKVALRKGEEVEYVMQPGWTAYTLRLGITTAFGLLSAGIGLLVLPLFLWIRKNARYGVTNERLIKASGLVFGGNDIYDIKDVDEIRLKEKLMDDQFGTKAVVMRIDGKKITWKGVPEPEYFKSIVEEKMNP